MSYLLNTVEKHEDFSKNIDNFKVICENYKNKDKLFQEDLLLNCLNNIQNDLSKMPSLYKVLVCENWCTCVTNMFKLFLTNNNWDLFEVICNFVVNFTDKSIEVCDGLINVGFSDLLIDVYIKANDNITHPPKSKSFFITIITVIHNIARHVHLQQYFLKHPQIDRFKTLIFPLRSDKNEATSIATTFVLIWLSKEKDFELIEENNGIIKIIFHFVKECLRYENHRAEEWSLSELLQGLQALASMDSMKNQMVHLEDFIPTIISIISSKLSSAEDIELSLGILWNLSFVDDNAELLNVKYELETLIKPLLRSDVKSIRHNAKGLLWNLKKHSDVVADTDNFKYDIFISYCHEQMDLVMKIERELKKTFKVWIDKDNIKGSSLEDMALGIEQSQLFVMCVSNSYKQSQFCHSEANYAYKMKKPIIPLLMEHKYKPDGWLGIMVCSEFYINVSEAIKLPDSLKKLVESIKYRLEKIVNCGSLEKPISVKPQTDYQNTVKDWSETEVLQWLSVNKLSIIQSKLDEFDGEMIEALIAMRLEAPQIYYKFLEKKLDLSLSEILKFSSALTKLQSQI